MLKALVIGSTGLLGSSLSMALSNQYEVTCTHHKNPPLSGFNSVNLSLTNFAELDKLFSENDFDLVFNCAGLTNVETCESRPEAAWQLNATLPYHLAILTQKYNARFVHISTDHFLSARKTPRKESEVMRAINQYGYSKLAGERYTMKFNASAVVLRTNFFGLTSLRSHSLLDFLVSKLSADEKIIGFEDVYFSPIGVSSLVSIIANLANHGISGLFHAAGLESISKFEFARLVSDALGAHKELVTAGSISSLGDSAPRPNYLALDSSRLASILGIQLPSIKSMLEVELRNAI